MGKKLAVFSLVLLSIMITAGSGCAWWEEMNQDKDQQALKDADTQKRELLEKIDRDFDNPELHYQLAQLYQRDGLWDKARQEYSVTLRFDPVHRPAQAGVVKTLMEAGDKNRAQMHADIYLDQAASSSAASLRLAMGFQNQDLDALAMRAYDQALELSPDSAKIHKQLGYYYLARDNEDKAREHLTQSIRLDPIQPEVASQLGKLGVSVTVRRRNTSSDKELEEAIEQSQ